ncbi:ABC transporter permease [Glaciihabitans tibetensis]|uniref:ABC transporter permease n=1 Tax=Glaciihabitans tibetensis TaxID=1266600 RepID=UPI003CCBE551
MFQFSSSFGFSAAGSALGQARRGSRRGWKTTILTILGGLLLPGLILLIWQLIASSGLVPSYRLPSPSSVFLAGTDLAARGELGLHVAISTQRVLLGFLFGSIVGLVVAATVGLSRIGSVVLSPSLGALRAVPSLAWLPLLALYLGYSEDQKVLLIAIGAFFPVYTTVSAALRHVDEHLVEAGRAYGYRGTALLRVVQLPAVVPSVVSALRLALAQSWLFLVAGELLGSSLGLGFLLNDSQNNGRIDRLFLAIVLLAVLGKITDGLVGVLERYLLKRWS